VVEDGSEGAEAPHQILWAMVFLLAAVGCCPRMPLAPCYAGSGRSWSTGCCSPGPKLGPLAAPTWARCKVLVDHRHPCRIVRLR
jgi:hypothetical protein